MRCTNLDCLDFAFDELDSAVELNRNLDFRFTHFVHFVD
tara:strand:- start:120 stop:236 length:117 start_codon:yes stop_codon:yes gene_type:complete